MHVTDLDGPTDADVGVRWTVAHAYEGSGFLRARLDDAGVDPHAVRGVADLTTLPFTTKDDLRSTYPYGWTAVPLDDVVRIHASSGTTGRRTVATYTARDLDDWARMFARCFEYAGVSAADRVQITPGYGLWTAGVGFQSGVERLGAMAVPAGPGNIDLQFELLRDFGSTVICATSSFGLLLGEEAHRRAIVDELSLRVGVFGSERWGEAMRRRIDDMLGIDSYDIYGLTELYGPGTGIECHQRDGMHYWDDHYVIEIIDPGTGAVLPAGSEGEVVLTTLRKQALPLLRYRTRDVSYVYRDPCPCGSPYPRLGRLKGRTDEMIKYRGVAIYPADIDTVLSAIAGLGSEYQVHITRERGHDDMTVRVEADTMGTGVALADHIERQLRSQLRARATVELVEPGSLPRTARKTQRVFDHRDD